MCVGERDTEGGREKTPDSSLSILSILTKGIYEAEEPSISIQSTDAEDQTQHEERNAKH